MSALIKHSVEEERPMKLRNRVALITGAGRGIGRAIAEGFAREGADLALAARRKIELEKTAENIQAIGRKTLIIPADVSNSASVENLVRMVLSEFGQIDVLVDNAGRQPPIGSLLECDPEDWVQTINVNLIGTMLCCKAVLPGMIERRQGKIINLSGGGATAPRPNFSAYAASKAAVVRFTETLAEELKPFNIQVNAIAPGAINTRMLDEVLTAGEAAGEAAMAQAKRQKETGGDSLEAAVALAVFLASDESGTLTGKLISAQHDPWREWAGRGDELNATPMYTIRRLDPFTIKPFLKDLV
jgi:NAD(P)-dependent dehydrogenase (short-subunit alcohol dehydrogenase family)